MLAVLLYLNSHSWPVAPLPDQISSPSPDAHAHHEGYTELPGGGKKAKATEKTLHREMSLPVYTTGHFSQLSDPIDEADTEDLLTAVPIVL